MPGCGFYLHQTCLQESNNVKDLGVVMVDQLKFITHVYSIFAQAQSRVRISFNVLWRLLRGLNAKLSAGFCVLTVMKISRFVIELFEKGGDFYRQCMLSYITIAI